VPHIFTCASTPVRSQIVTSIELPGGNISGATNGIPIELQVTNARKMMAFKRLAVIFNSREDNSNIWYFGIKEVAKKLGFEVIGLRSPPETNELEKNLDKLINRTVSADAVYLPTDSYVISKAEYIGGELKRAKLFSFGGIEKYIQNGATMGTAADYYYLGQRAAEIVDKNQKGTPLNKIPVKFHENPHLVINKTTCAILGMTIPDHLLSNAIIVE
jgi:putative ABC transport system substrate-binding protein